MITSSSIAFYAYIAKDVLSYPLLGDQLVFDVVPINIGNGYNAQDGYFITPETGTYVFTWTTTENGSCLSTTELMVNAESIGFVFMHSQYSDRDFLGTGFVVTHVNTGDHVYVMIARPWHNCSRSESVIVQRSSFSGWKL